MTAGCSYTINTPADGATQRDRLTLGSFYETSLAETSCSSGTCSTVTDTAHVQELLTVSTNCNGAVLSPTSPTGDKWYDYGTPVSVRCNGVWGRASGSGTRATSWNWDGGANTNVATLYTFTSSAEPMSAGHSFNVNTVAQYQLTLDSGATEALSSVTHPAITGDYYWYDAGTPVNYVGNGIFGRSEGTGNRSTNWSVDSGSSTTLSSPSSFTIPLTMGSTHTIHVTVSKQYQVTLSTSTVSMLSSITSPTLSGDNYWYDSGTAVKVILDGIGSRSAGVGTRLTSYSINGGASVSVASLGTVAVLNGTGIGAAEYINASVVTQYQLKIDTGASFALSSITPPPIAGDNYWYDSGTEVTYTGNGVYGRTQGEGERVSSWWVDSNTPTTVLTTGTFPVSIVMTAPHSLHTTTISQYQVNLTGTYGVAQVTPPTIPGDNYWYDTGTVVSLSLQGVFDRASGTGERVVSYSVNNGGIIGVTTSGPVPVLSSVSLTSPYTVSVQTVTQYELSLDKTTVTALSSITPPTINGDNYWYDLGTPVTLTLNGIWERNATEGFRLTSYAVDGSVPVTVATSGTVTISLGQITYARSVSSTQATQFLLTVIGGAGITYSTNPPIPKDTGWYDSGTILNVSTRGTFDSNGSTRQRVSSWVIDSGVATTVGTMTVVTVPSIVMNSPHVLTFRSTTQYHVLIAVKDDSGSVTLSNAVILVTANGATQTAMEGSVWTDSGATLQVTNVNWKGVDVTPSQSTAYSVVSPLNITVKARVYAGEVSVKDLLGFSIGGAAYTITFANQTIIHGTTPGNGVINLGMVPLGTFQGSVSYLGATTSFSGDASVNPTTGVTVPLSFSLIAVVAAVVAAVVIVFVYLYRRSMAEQPESS
jgi:hypothetical protein